MKKKKHFLTKGAILVKETLDSVDPNLLKSYSSGVGGSYMGGSNFTKENILNSAKLKCYRIIYAFIYMQAF